MVRSPQELAELTQLFAPLTMLLEPVGAGVRNFCERALRPRYAERLPRSFAALQVRGSVDRVAQRGQNREGIPHLS